MQAHPIYPRIKKLVYHMKHQTVDKEWYSQVDKIAAERSHLEKMLARPDAPKVYGANTLVGHLDNITIDEEAIDAFQNELIRNHTIGGTESYSVAEIKCISYAKVHAFSLGGSGISQTLYTHLLSLIEAQYFPSEVPKSASYSSGDVIPGAHWAGDIAEKLAKDYGYQLQGKEALSCINGSFVHVGVALEKLDSLQAVWSLFNYNSLLYATLLKDNQAQDGILLHKSDSMKYPFKQLHALGFQGHDEVQFPVSIRAYPQTASALFNCMLQFMQAIEEQLTRKSDNPLIIETVDFPVSQASFLAPMLSLSTNQLIDSLLMVMWQIEQRIHYLLSGKVEHIPLNARKKAKDLGFIQLPKLVTAILEETRLQCGMNTFSSGGATSYGTEDLWTKGLFNLERLAKAMEGMNKILAIELALMIHIDESFLRNTLLEDTFHVYSSDEHIRELYLALSKDNLHKKLPIAYELEPFASLI